MKGYINLLLNIKLVLKRTFFAVVLFLHFCVAHSQSGWSLDQCISYAINNNISLKQSALSNQVNKNNSEQSKAQILPSLNLGASHTYNFGKTIDRFTNTFADTRVLSQNFYATSNFVLWSGLSQYYNVRASEYTYMSGLENLKQQQNDLALNVATAFINVIFADELLKISVNQFDITNEQLERTKKLVAAGSLAKSVELDIKAQLANDEVNVTTSENNYQLALLSLQQLMNYDSISDFKIEKPNIEVLENQLLGNSVQSIYETALKNQPGIKSGDYATMSAHKTFLSSKGRVSPTISMNASIGTGYSGLAKDVSGYNSVSDTLGIIPGIGPLVYDRQDPIFRETPFTNQFENNVNKSIGFTITIPVFNGLQTQTSIKNAKINLLNSRYSQDLNKQNLYKTIAQAYLNAKAALNKYNASKQSVSAAEESFDFAQKKFNAGSISSFDFSTSKNRLFTAQSNMIQAKYDYIFKLKVLDYYQGKSLGF